VNSLIEDKKGQLLQICKNLKVNTLHVFGSASSDRMHPTIDIDFLVSFSKELLPTEYSENYFSLREQLVDLFEKEIDLVTESSLSNPYFISSVDRTKQLVYAA
jgi:hypothetical protein